MDLTIHQKRTIQSLELLQKFIISDSTLDRDTRFLFRELGRIDRLAMSRPNNTMNKSKLNSFVELAKRRTVATQCILLTTSNWIQNVAIRYSRLLAECNRHEPDYWRKRLRRLGPIFKGMYWAESIHVGANYVRHFSEWDFQRIDFDSNSGKIKPLKNIIKTLRKPDARRTAQFLIDLKIPQSEIFSTNGYATNRLLVSIDSNKAYDLKKYGDLWEKDVTLFAEREVVSALSRQRS